MLGMYKYFYFSYAWPLFIGVCGGKGKIITYRIYYFFGSKYIIPANNSYLWDSYFWFHDYIIFQQNTFQKAPMATRWPPK